MTTVPTLSYKNKNALRGVFWGLLTLILLVSKNVQAQEEAYSKSLIEKFTNLAIQYNPEVNRFKDQAAVSQYLIRVKKISWLNQIIVSGNLNEFSISPSLSANTLTYFPRYNILVTIPLGIFFTRPKEIKLAQSRFEEDMDAFSKEKADIRNKISDKVQEYLFQKEQNNILQKIADGSKITLQNKEKAFQQGKTTLIQYLEAKSLYNNALINSLKTKRDYVVAGYDLELLIGRSLEEYSKL